MDLIRAFENLKTFPPIALLALACHAFICAWVVVRVVLNQFWFDLWRSFRESGYRGAVYFLLTGILPYPEDFH